MANLSTEIKFLKGIGAVKSRELERLGLKTLKDVLFDFPFRHDDLSNTASIGGLESGQKVTIQGRVAQIQNRKSAKNQRMMITEATIEDGTGSVKAVWFHQGYLTKNLKSGTLVSLSGKVDDQYGLSIVNPVYEIVKGGNVVKHTGRIVPIYALTGSITQKIRRQLVERALEFIDEVEDWVPQKIRDRENLVDIFEALREMHFPHDKEKAETALSRLKFDEFFLHQLLHGKVRRDLKKQKAPVIAFDEKVVQAAIKELPFELTDAQKKALWAIIKDMERDEPMNRLLEGDVGTGKTLVAALAARNASAQGWQTAMLAPTEILAGQHGQTLHKFFRGQLRIAVFTRTKRFVGEKEVTKVQMLEALRNGKIDLVVGTHALLSDNVLFDRLGLIIVDEQHRFGVKQRKALKDREGDSDGIPHLLSMTATPIPRSLALVLYGDLDRSLLDEYPVGRKPIETFLMTKQTKRAMFEKIQEEMDAGRQAFVVCPLIEESDALGVKSVSEVYEAFEMGPFRAYNLAMLHGKMKSSEKDAVMAQFMAGEIDMMISTTVVEVGVDVPNATVMFIEGAERFGLAQLHQLRGRIGRGEHESFCFLHPTDDKMSSLAEERLTAVTRTQNGFVLAEKDLKLRGPGNIFGTDQSGFENFKLGSYADIDLISVAKDWAKEYLDEDPSLDTWPLLRERVLDYVEEIHFE